MFNMILFGTVVMMLMLFLFALPVEFIWTKIVNNYDKEEELSSKVVSAEILDKSSYKKDEFTNPLLMTINPGLWVLMNAMKQPEEGFVVSVLVDGQKRSIKVSKSMFDSLEKGENMNVQVKETLIHSKISLFEMCLMEEFKRNRTFHNIDYSVA